MTSDDRQARKSPRHVARAGACFAIAAVPVYAAGSLLADQGLSPAAVASAVFGGLVGAAVVAFGVRQVGASDVAAAVTGGVVAVVAVGVIAATLWPPSGFDRAAYTRANHRVVDSLPRLSRARKVREHDVVYRIGDAQEGTGVMSLIEYRVPPQTTRRAVAQFYRRALQKDWRLIDVRPSDGVQSGLMDFARGPAGVSVNLAQIERTDHYELSVDQRRYR